MIPAIDPGIGLKDDRPEPKASRSENPAFHLALKRAGGAAEKSSGRSIADARAAGDSRARREYAEAADETQRAADQRAREAASTRNANSNRKADRPAEARREGDEPAGDLEQAARQAANPLQPSAAAQAAEPGAEGDDPALAGTVLEAVEQPALFGVPDDATPITAQIGTAAYRLGAHGKGEAQLAEAQGLILPGSTAAEMLGQGVRDVKQATLQEAEGDDPTLPRPAPAEAALADETDVLQLSQHARTQEQRGLSHKDQIALQTAQARNEVLARLTAAGGETATDGQGHPDALRQHLQLQGLLARNARAHALEPAAPGAPPSQVAGTLPAANSADLTQVFETPQDDAVEQRVLERVANEARWMLRNDRQEVTLRLHPEHLGSLHMKVQHKDGVFTVQLTVDNLSAKHLLESNLQDLRNRLAGEHPGGEFQFNVDVRQGNEQPSLYARAQRPAPAGIGRVGALEQAPAPGMAGRTIAQSGLSIYV